MSSRPANKRQADPTVEKSANKKPANKKEVVIRSFVDYSDDECFEPTQTQADKHAELTPDPATVAATSKSALAVGLGGALPKTLIWKVLLPDTHTVRES